MSLDTTDLQAIRSIVSDELKKEIEPLKGEVTALSNDVKEIYDILVYNGLKVILP